MAIESNLAGVARVAFEAQTGEFNADVQRAERVYKDATSGMSDGAIKLELAQERLRRSLAKGPTAAREQARALLAVRQAERDLAVQSDKTTRELAQQERQLGRVTRGAIAGSGVFHGLGRSIAFASGTFLGGAGLVYALRSTIEAGRDAEASAGRVAVAVRNSGNEYERYRKQIDQTITKQSELSAFDDEDLADSFAKLVIRTKDVNEALRLNGLVADVARGRNISLEAATQLVIKASLNQAGQLRRVGIEVGKNTTAQELLNKLTAAYAGQAERYGREGAGAQERLSVAIENTEETIAQGLLPTVTNLSNAVSDWLSKSENQKRIQHDVNEVVKAGTGIVRGMATVLEHVHDVLGPVVRALGGIEKATELAFGLALVVKIRKAAGAMGLISGSSARVSAQGIEQATAFGRAWDLATRPRNMVVTTTVNGTPGVPGAPGTGLPGTGVPTQRPTTRGRSVADRINQYGTPPPPRTVPTIGGGALGGLIIGGLAFGQAGEQQNAKVAYDTETDTFVLVDGSGRRYATLSEDDARRAAPTVYRRAQQYRARVRKPIPPGMRATDRPIAGEGSRTRSVGSTGGGGARTSGNTPTPRTLLDIQTDLARARTTAGTGDDVRYLTEERDRFRRQITFLENRKSLTDKQKQLLQNLYGELGSAQSELDGIAEDREAALDKQRQDAQDRRDRLRKARHAKAKAAQDKQLKAELEFAKSLSIGAKKQLEGRFPMGDKTLKRIDPDDLKPKNDPAKKNDPNAMTRDELGGILRDFLTGFGDMVDRYYGNVGVGGSISTATLEHLTRQTNGILSDALSRPQVGFRRVIDEAAMQT